MKRPILAVMASLLAAPALGASWTEGASKGLSFYTLAGANLSLTVVCDPAGSYSPPVAHLIIVLDGKSDISSKIAVFSGSEKIEANLVHGILEAGDIGPKVWQKLLRIASAKGILNLAAEGKSVSITVDKTTAFDCPN